MGEDLDLRWCNILGSIGLSHFYDTPTCIPHNFKIAIKKAFYSRLSNINDPIEPYPYNMSSCQQFYLSFTTQSHSRFLLSRFRFCTLHFFMAFPRQVGWSESLSPCPCDNRAEQSTKHLMLFCTLYSVPRVRYLRPILREAAVSSHQEGFLFLQSLSTTNICRAVLDFIRCSIRIRNKYEFLQ